MCHAFRVVKNPTMSLSTVWISVLNWTWIQLKKESGYWQHRKITHRKQTEQGSVPSRWIRVQWNRELQWRQLIIHKEGIWFLICQSIGRRETHFTSLMTVFQCIYSILMSVSCLVQVYPDWWKSLHISRHRSSSLADTQRLIATRFQHVNFPLSSCLCFKTNNFIVNAVLWAPEFDG